MFGIGPEELMLIAIIALLVLGPERMPRLMRDVGRIVGDLRRTSEELQKDFMNADKYLEKSATSIAATVSPPEEAKPAADPNESAFDREMREAKERLRET
jgi:Tat protein translocase TatB subunit